MLADEVRACLNTNVTVFLHRYGKPGCDADTCDYFLSYRRIGMDVEYEMSADTDGWVAVGFSSDKKMVSSLTGSISSSALNVNKSSCQSPLLFDQGGDDVMACVHDDNGRVRIHHFYNVGQWAKEIKRNPARDEEGIFENNRVTCRFKRPLYVPREETLVDLHLSWYYLFAWGPAIQGDSAVCASVIEFFTKHFTLILIFCDRIHYETRHRQPAGQRPHDQHLQV